MTIRYGNDILLTEFAREAEAQFKSMKEYLRDGHLDGAFLRAMQAQEKLEKFMWRLNDIKYREGREAKENSQNG